MAKPKRFVEDDLQEVLVRFFRMLIPSHIAQIWAIPNGGYRNPAEAIRLRNQGVTPGVPDLVIVMGGGKVVWVEVKRPANKILGQKAGILSEAQKKTHLFLSEQMGHLVHVIDNVNSFHDLLKDLNLLEQHQTSTFRHSSYG